MYNFLIDVDGVLTTGQFLYDSSGKKYKIFGPDDSDALKILKDHMKIRFITADYRGYEISEKRINDMGFNLVLVKDKRLKWMKKWYDLNEVIYMGDSFTDIEIFKHVKYSITTNDCFYLCKEHTNYVTKHNGGNRAIADAVFHLIKEFNIPYVL